LIQNIFYEITIFSRQNDYHSFKVPYAYPMGIILLFYFFCVQPVFGQTSIIAIRLNDQVVAGADSKRLLTFGSGPEFPVSEPNCKIGIGDGFFFAIAGLSHDIGIGFRPDMIISKAPKISGTIEQKVEMMEEMIKKPLTESLDRYRRRYPLNYQVEFKRGSALQIIFFGLEKGSTFVTARDFFATRSALVPTEINVIRYKCPGDCTNGEAIFILGESDAIAKFAQQPTFWAHDPIRAVRKLIELEITDAPNIVGPPIDILQIDGNGARWIQKKEECPDIH
jgi:hypothetical protein